MSIFDDIVAEMNRQDQLWGEQNHPNGTGNPYTKQMAEEVKVRNNTKAGMGRITWEDILEEETLEAMAEEHDEPLRAELIQVAAVAAQWIKAIDRKNGQESASE